MLKKLFIAYLNSNLTGHLGLYLAVLVKELAEGHTAGTWQGERNLHIGCLVLEPSFACDITLCCLKAPLWKTDVGKHSPGSRGTPFQERLPASPPCSCCLIFASALVAWGMREV